MAKGTRKPRGARGRAYALLAIFGLAGILMAAAGCGIIGEKYAWIEWYTYYFEKYYVRWFADFEKAHADEHVRIKFRAMPSSAQQKVYTMLMSHTLSDVIVLGGDTAALLHEQDALEPISDADIDRGDYMPMALRLATRADGTLVGFPSGAGIRPFIYFSQKALDQAGTSADEVPETFDEYIAWASRLAKWDLDGKTHVGAPPAADAHLARRPVTMIRGYVRSSYPFIFAYVDPLPDDNGVSDSSIDDYLGGPPSNRPFRFDTPEFIKGLTEYQKWFLPKRTAISDSDTAGMQGFQQDVYAGMEGANWIYGEVYNMDFKVSRFPHAPGRRPKLCMESGSVGVSRKSRHKRLAIEFAKFITSADSQVDAYYGHGYTPCRLSAWKRLYDDDKADQEIRARFLGPFGGGSGDFICVPQIKRRNHDTMDVIAYVSLPVDRQVLKVASGDPAALAATAEAEAAGAAPAVVPETPQPEVDTSDFEARYAPIVQKAADDIARFSGQNVTFTVQGTPPEMIEARSFYMKSPIPVYTPLLADCGVWTPYHRLWTRINSEVITRMLEFVARENAPMTPEEAAKWAQKEAEDIVAGRK